ncbi:nitroreductase [Ralstonia soli]|uniref:Nitroreductase n=1 Tax=Ralstonia soli TaxID=2953896 RepID=A0ABT1AE90_9RALS|nr:nitroreductase [Ralstonia soli]MCO5396700.1 nitroreductase [Ralstonia soli]
MLKLLLDERRSCRAFKSTVLPRATILDILAAAQKTASDCNIQPWRIRIISGNALDRLRRAMYERALSGASLVSDVPPIASYFGVYQDRRRDCGWQLYSALEIARGDRFASGKQALENFRFFGAPHLALVTTPASLGVRGVLDCGGYLTTFMLAASALGVGTVPQASIAYRADVIREQLGIPADEHVVYGVSFGWPDESHPVNSYRTSRAPLEEVVDFIDV